MLVNVSSFPTRIMPAATASRMMWWLIALCFFDNVDSGMLMFCTMVLLSTIEFQIQVKLLKTAASCVAVTAATAPWHPVSAAATSRKHCQQQSEKQKFDN